MRISQWDSVKHLVVISFSVITHVPPCRSAQIEPL